MAPSAPPTGGVHGGGPCDPCGPNFSPDSRGQRRPAGRWLSLPPITHTAYDPRPMLAPFVLIASLLTPSVEPAPAAPIAALTLSVAEALLERPKATPATKSQGRELSVHWGTFGIGDSEVIFEGGLEYRFPARDFAGLFELHPIIGTSLLADGGIYIYGGARHEWYFTDRLFLAPSFAAGIYQHSGVDLGGPLEFRSGIDLGARVSDHIEAALGIYHLSNGGLYSLNGGAESALFSLAFGL